ncbi:MAG: hypothetical protein LBS96_09620 [Oscillospiraceae bacterium]|jgi:hypothetical protein|nr:hypothetical protein [Oscillospiraceae bacterium]
MQKTKRILAVVALVCLLVTTLAACSGSTLNGTYQTGDGLLSQSYSFDTKGNVDIKAAGITVASGTYEVKNGRLYITTSTVLLGENTQNYSFEKKGKDLLIIGGTAYTKVG